ncbi:N-(5'-phosphoribosyl)anthranilate isomerase [Tsukamurella serpentis]
MFVKVCGLRTRESVEAAVAAGADAIGFVFAPGSVRLIDAQAAAGLISAVPDSMETVGVFRGQPIDEVLRLARASRVRTIQLHGDEPAEHFARAAEAGFATIRAISATRFTRSGHDGAERLLIDATVPGSGATFDPADLPVPPSTSWLLAGGLRPDNVADLIAAFGPSGVDVSSGVESAPGVKDPGLIREFVATAKS